MLQHAHPCTQTRPERLQGQRHCTAAVPSFRMHQLLCNQQLLLWQTNNSCFCNQQHLFLQPTAAVSCAPQLALTLSHIAGSLSPIGTAAVLVHCSAACLANIV